jgi:hypothetical protein
MADEGRPLKYQCCFCGESVEGEPPRELVLQLDEEATQQLWCHETCLRGALHPSVPVGS